MDPSDWLPNAAKTNGVSDVCKYHTLKILQHVWKRSPWALRMLDASAKIPESIMDGNGIVFGNYEECLDVDVNEDWGSFVGQHCVTMTIIPVKMLPQTETLKKYKSSILPLATSICTPSTCTPGDLQYIFTRLGNMTIVDPTLCHHKNGDPPFQPLEWFTIGLLTLIGIFCIISTTYDILITNKEKRNRIMLLFSWYTNGKSLFSTEAGSDSLLVLHGLRFFSMLWIVGGHCAIMGKIQPTVNFLHYIKQTKLWSSLIATNTPFAVDTFFVISGLLLSYVFLNVMASGQRFILPLFYIHRILRVTPVLALVVLVHVSILHRLGSGPMWEYFLEKTIGNYCTTNWWSTLLYIQNYVNPQKLCVTVSWFLAVDMQMYILSPIFLLALHKRPKLGLGLLLLAAIIGTIATFVDTYVHEDTPNNAKIGIRLNSRYYYTHTRCVSWIVGVAGGYLLHKTVEWRRRIEVGTETFPRMLKIFGWTVFTVTILGVIQALYPFEQDDYVYSAVEASFYFALTRPLWSICIVWIVFACSCGVGGTVNSILAWPGFRPLGRLTFCMYLIHFEVLLSVMFSAKLPIYTGWDYKMPEFAAVYMIALFLAIIVSLSIEAPIIGLEKILLHRGKRNKLEQHKGIKSTNNLVN